MKLKIGIILIMVISFILFLKISSPTGQNTYKNLATILKAADSNNIQIKEWVIYYRIMKENVDQNTLGQLISSIKSDKSYNWTEDGEENHHKNITGIKRRNKDELQTLLAFNKNGNFYNINISYRIKSSDNLTIKKINDLYIPEQFKKGTQYFTVMGSTKNGLNLKQLSSNILDSLSARYVEGLQEKRFISISGLTNKWGNQIKSKEGENFNVQVGVRESENGMINTTIGTPIITTEY